MFEPALERMPSHLAVVTEVDGETIRTVNVEDPFHTTNVFCEMDISFGLWERIKLLFTGKYTAKTHVRIKVRADGVAIGRWFQRAVLCDRCRRNRIDDPHHPLGHDCGYHHGKERWCEQCYYAHPIVEATEGPAPT